MGWGYGIDIILAVVMCSALDRHDTYTWFMEVLPHPTLILNSTLSLSHAHSWVRHVSPPLTLTLSLAAGIVMKNPEFDNRPSEGAPQLAGVLGVQGPTTRRPHAVHVEHRAMK